MKFRSLALLAFLIFVTNASGQLSETEQAWNRPVEPFRIAGNVYYVGAADLSSYLITTPKGHILLDSGMLETVPLVRANIESLGFSIRDVRLILNSHAHFDHAGGIAALQQASGAEVAASSSGAMVLRAGTVGADDPQFGVARAFRFPAVARVREVRDGERLRVGELAVTAHLTPGHTPGSTTWTWRSCDAQGCIDAVYADSLNPVSTGDFRFGRLAASFRASIDKVASLPCDMVVPVHPGFTGIVRKAAERTGDHNPFVQPGGCKAYAAEAARRLDERLAKEATR